jgi:GT2 family glycosyltransferase
VDDHDRVLASCARFPSVTNFLAAMVGLDKLLPRVFPPHLMSDWSHTATADVAQVIGAFFLVRTSLFRSLAGFDERFFLYFEEVDFSLRANRAGWTSRYLIGARAFHRGEGTTYQIRSERLFYSLRSRLLYCFKHFPAVWAVAVLGATLFLEPLARCTVSLGRRGWRGLLETVRGYRSLWRALPAIVQAIKADPTSSTRR